MATGGKDRLNIRVGVEGGDDVRRVLESLGASGKRAFDALRNAANDIRTSTQGLAGELGNLRSRLNDVGQAAGAIGERFRFVGGEIARVGATLAAAFSVRALIQMTSAWADLSGRIRNAIPPSEDAATVMQRIADVADRTYQSIETVADGYATSARALRELGMTTNQSLDFFEALNNAMTVSGARGAQAESVMRALTRAMQEGQLSGANFQAVMDNGGRVLGVLADRLGVGISELRGMAKEGRITSKVIQDALISSLSQLRAEADGMDTTIVDGFQRIQNAMLRWVGTTDQATGTSAALANGLVWVAKNFDTVAKTALAVAAAFVLVKGVGLAIEMVSLARSLLMLIGPLAKVSALLIASPWGLAAVALITMSVAVLALTGNLDSFAGIIANTVKSLAGFGQEAEEAGNKTTEAMSKASQAGTGIQQNASQAAKAMADIGKSADDTAGKTDTASMSIATLGDSGAAAGEEINESFVEVGETVVELDESVKNLTTSLVSMGQAARDAARETSRALNGGQGPSVNRGGTPGFSGGGRVFGAGTGTSDSILARLSNGEFVVRAAAVRKYGARFLHAINGMRLDSLPAFAGGGAVDLSAPLRETRAAMALPRIRPNEVDSGRGVGGQPLTLNIDGQTFEGLIAPEEVATKLTSYATERQVRRAGKTPSWYR